jgi:ADP-ribose pyrophosphatase YjhB (NUDIX family)
MSTDNNKWIVWANHLSSLAQNGLHFCKDPFDIERYHSIKKLAAEIISEYTELSTQKVIDLFNYEKGYVTPRIDVRGAVFKDEKILLVREKSDHCWTLPGGWADVNESASEAAVREVKEESGYNVKAVKLISLYDKQKHNHPPQLPHAYKAIFLCELIGGVAKTSIETTEIGFFGRDELPPLSLHRILPSQVKRAFEHADNLCLPTDFD